MFKCGLKTGCMRAEKFHAARVIRDDEDVSKGVFAKDPSATYTPAYHVHYGSYKGVKTQYISASRDVEYAAQYMIEHGNSFMIVIALCYAPMFLDCSTWDRAVAIFKALEQCSHKAGYFDIPAKYAQKSAEILFVKALPRRCYFKVSREEVIEYLAQGKGYNGLYAYLIEHHRYGE